MKRLPLYREDEKTTIIDRAVSLPRNVNCRLCPRGGALTPGACLAPWIQEGHTMVGAILVVGGEPTVAEAVNDKIFASSAAVELRLIMAKLAAGRSIVYDRAIRCAPHDDKEKMKSNERVDPCRGYMRSVLDTVKPDRIFAFGGHAHESLLGRRPDQDSIRRGYAYLADGTVVYLFKNFGFAVYNTFEAKELEEDIAWALHADPPKPPWDGSYYMVETVEHAQEAIRAMYDAGPYFTFDLETSGPFRDDGYRLLCGAFSPAGWINDTFLFTEDCLLIPEVKALLAKLLLDRMPCGHNLQFDLKHIWSWVGLIEPTNDNAPVFETTIHCDTMWVIRQRDNRCAKALSHAAEVVGMGGHKKRNADSLKAARREIKQRMKDYVDAGYNLDGLLLLPNRMRGTIHAAVRFLCEVDPKGKNVDGYSHGLVPPDIEYQYCALDTVSTSRLVESWAHFLHPSEEERAADPEAQRMWFQWHEFTEPVIKVAAQMEIWGLPTNPTVLHMLRKKVDRVVADCEKKLRNLGFTAPAFTVETIRTYLFTTLDYPVLTHKDSLTDTGLPSTSSPALDVLNAHFKKSTKTDDPIIRLLQDRASAEKIAQSFTMSVAGRVTSKGVIHHSLMPEGADTGRWASKEPNTQNLPTHGPWAKGVKKSFRAEDPDHVFIQVDYASMELRDAAGLSMDKKYAGVFLRKEDPHLGTAKLVWDLEDMTADEMVPWRSKAKCYHPETEVLTKHHGWMQLFDVVRKKDLPEIAICEPAEISPGGAPKVSMRFERPTEAFEEFHPDGELLRFRGGKLNADVTPDHGMLVWDEEGKPKKICAAELAGTEAPYTWAVSAEYENTDLSKLPEVIRNLGNEQIKALFKCCAIFQARAYFWKERGGWFVLVDTDISALDFQTAGLSVDVEKDPFVYLRATRLALAPTVVDFLQTVLLGRMREEPHYWWMELPAEVKRIYLKTRWKLGRDHLGTGDGYRRITFKDRIDADLIQAMAATCGLYSEIEKRKNAKHKYPKTFYDVFLEEDGNGSAGTEVHGHSFGKNVDVKNVPYYKQVACVTVSSGYILTRRAGTTLICGNTVNFGVLFGKSVYTLAPELETTESGAQEVIDSIFGEYKDLAIWIEGNKKFVADNGFQYTYWWMDGKWVSVNKRYLTSAGSPDFKHRSAADRQATNTTVQGSSALKTTWACINVVREIHEKKLPVKLRNAVHDSLILTGHRENALETCAMVKGVMERCQSWIVPTVAEPELGPSWAEMIDLEKLRLFASMVQQGIDDQSISHLMELCRDNDYKPEVVEPYRTGCERIGLL